MSLNLKEKLKTIIQLVSEPKVFRSLLSFRSFGYILETGWLNSFKDGNPVDSDFRPIPWFTYSAIDFLKDKLRSDFTLLEFGSGNSTLFWSERVNEIVSLEHNIEWFEKLRIKIPENVELILTSSKSPQEYLSILNKMQKKFDLIVIDGIFRNECLKESLNLISNKGIIILDDSERKEYKEGVDIVINSGFKKIEFSGIAPGIFFRKCTAVFYRYMNLFDI